MNEWFCTVFPNDLDEMPQDFESYVEVKEYKGKVGKETYICELNIEKPLLTEGLNFK